MAPEAVAPLRFGPAVSPHLAAELARTTIDPAAVVAAARAAADGAEAVVVEGVGGLLVPPAPDWVIRGLPAALGLPGVVAPRPRPGTNSPPPPTVRGARGGGA